MKGGGNHMARSSSGKGRGWHGDSEGHARAGRKGGQARGRKSSRSEEE